MDIQANGAVEIIGTDLGTFNLGTCIPTGSGRLEFGGLASAFFSLNSGSYSTVVVAKGRCTLRTNGAVAIRNDLEILDDSRFETNSGSLVINGTLIVNHLANMECNQNVPISIERNIQLLGDGRLNAQAPVTVSGNISVSGTADLRVKGGRITGQQMEVTTVGHYIIALDNMNPETAVVDLAILSGVLELDLEPLFLPQTNTPITILRFGQRIGEFSQVVQPSRSLFTYKIEYTPGEIQATAEEAVESSGSVMTVYLGCLLFCWIVYLM